MAIESQVHEYGKMLFEDAVGQMVKLPASPSPRFHPPKTFSVKRVEFERGVPWAGYAGRQPDVVLTSEQGTKLVVEIKNSNGKDNRYLEDMAQAGFNLVAELDVSVWKRRRPDLRPDFSDPQMLQGVMNQVRWLSPGKPCQMSWRPYGMVLYTSCAQEAECDASCRAVYGGQGFVRSGADGQRLDGGKMFYRFPEISLAAAAEQLGMTLDDTRTHIYQLLVKSYCECKGLSVVTRGSNGTVISMADRNPGDTERETGWVLCQDGTELPDYRIRKVEADRYQAIVYPCALGGNQMLPVAFDESRRDVTFPVQPRWSLAVHDLFGRLAPLARRIYETPEDPWRPLVGHQPWLHLSAAQGSQ